MSLAQSLLTQQGVDPGEIVSRERRRWRSIVVACLIVRSRAFVCFSKTGSEIECRPITSEERDGQQRQGITQFPGIKEMLPAVRDGLSDVGEVIGSSRHLDRERRPLAFPEQINFDPV